MNLSVSVLVNAKEARIVEALAGMLPSEGRPVFSDEVKPEWNDVYQAIRLLMPPTKLTRYDDHLFIQWYETEYMARTIQRVFENAGAMIQFIHSMEGEPAAADDDCDDSDLGGVYYLFNDGALRLTESNITILLPQSGLQWLDDIDANVQQIVTYLTSKP